MLSFPSVLPSIKKTGSSKSHDLQNSLPHPRTNTQTVVTEFTQHNGPVSYVHDIDMHRVAGNWFKRLTRDAYVPAKN